MNAILDPGNHLQLEEPLRKLKMFLGDQDILLWSRQIHLSLMEPYEVADT